MIQSEYLSLINSGVGDSRSDVAIAKSLAQSLRRTQEGTADLAILLSSIYSFCADPSDMATIVNRQVKYPGVWGDFYRHEITAEEYESISSEFNAANKNPTTDPVTGWTGTTYSACTDTDAFLLSVGSTGITLLDHRIFMIERVGPPGTTDPTLVHWYVFILKDLGSYLPDLKNPSIGYITSKILYGRGVLTSYCSILESAAQALTGGLEDASKFATSISSVINNMRSLTNYDKNDFLLAAASGVKGIVDVIANKLKVFKEDADEAQGMTFLSDTSISVSQFAPGMILGIIEGVLTVVSLVAFALNKIVGVITTVLGAIIVAVGKVVLAATTAYEDTRFSIAWNKEGRDSVFSFCVNQETISFDEIAAYMRSNGYSYCTIYEKQYRPLVHYIFLTYPDRPNSGEINIETHLSLDFDVFQGTASWSDISSALSSLGLSSVALERIYYGTRNYYPYTGNTLYMIQNPDTSHYVLLGNTNRIVGYPELSKYSSLPFVSLGKEWDELMTPREFCEFSYKPLTLPFLSSVQSMFSDKLEATLWRRLCSSLLLIWYEFFFYEAVGNFTSPWRHQPLLLAHYSDFTVPGTPSLSLTANGLQDFYLGLTWPVRDSNGSFSTGDADHINATQRDRLDGVILGIEKFFDQVVMSKVLNPTLNNFQSTRWNLYTLYWDTTSAESTPNMNAWQVGNLNFNYYTLRYVRFLPLLEPIPNSEVTLLQDATLVETWPTGCLVDIPTLTFSGYLAGLIVDGLIAVAIIAVTVVALVAKTKIKNKRAQLQARAESAWYNYSDNYDSSGTAQANDDNALRWKEYKRARLKYNALALLTGGSTLSMGLYDDSGESSTFSLVDTLKDRFSQTSEEISQSTVDVEGIKTLITGVVPE